MKKISEKKREKSRKRREGGTVGLNAPHEKGVNGASGGGKHVFASV